MRISSLTSSLQCPVRLSCSVPPSLPSPSSSLYAEPQFIIFVSLSLSQIFSPAYIGAPEINEVDRSAAPPPSATPPLLDALRIHRDRFKERLPRSVLAEFKTSGRDVLLHRPIAWALFKQLEALDPAAPGSTANPARAAPAPVPEPPAAPAPSPTPSPSPSPSGRDPRTPFGHLASQPPAAAIAAADEDPATPFDALPDRAVQHLLDYALAAFGAGQRGWLVDGKRGTGKSSLLVSAVQWARERGWCVLYVPSGFMATGLDGWPGGFFQQHEKTGTYDTPDIARRFLSDLLGGNQEALGKIQCKTAGATGTLGAFVAAAVSGRPEQATTAALAVLEELRRATEVPVLAVIDDYNALYGYTVFGRWTSMNDRKMLQPEELRLASALRLLEGPAFARGLVLCANTRSKSVPRDLAIPLGSTDAPFKAVEMPPFGRLEARALNQHYVAAGAAQRPRAEDFEALYFLTQGNGRLVRELSQDVDYCFMDQHDEGLLPGDVVKFNQVPFGCPPWGLSAPFPKDLDLRRRAPLPKADDAVAPAVAVGTSPTEVSSSSPASPARVGVAAEVQAVLLAERGAEKAAAKLKKLARGLAALGVA